MTNTEGIPGHAHVASVMMRRDRARLAAVAAHGRRASREEAAITSAMRVTNLPAIVGAAKMATLHRVFLTDEEAGLIIRAAFEAAGFEVTE
jgi:hypothetical protein